MNNTTTRPMTREEKKIIFASSLGTVFEWYDFYLFGSLAIYISKHYFSAVNPTAAFIFTLLGFAAGFAVRPFGALVFGRMGDLAGRKYTFLITILIMGLSTTAVGLIPSYATWGIAAPVILIALRLAQGLALGGEYGGAATYIAEHAPPGKRGFYTSWIQTTATLGLFLSLLVILGIREYMGEAAFASWGWRLPFILSIILLVISVWIRLSLSESPVFLRMKEEKRRSTSPLKDSFGNWGNLRLVLIALFGLTAAEGVVWYGGQFYALFFLLQTLKVTPATAQILIAVALVLGTPFFVIFGWLSDKIGRKPIILSGFLLAALVYFPIFNGLTHFANPALEAAMARSPVTVVTNPGDCSFQFNPAGTSKFTKSCDVAVAALAKAGVTFVRQSAPAGTTAQIKIGDKSITSYDATGLAKEVGAAKDKAFTAQLTAAIKDAGFPSKADPKQMNMPMVVLLLFILVVLVTMVYGPIAAILTEMFPARIRYTSMSLPYHIGNGWFGGFLPAITFAIVAATGNIYAGLWYPIIISVIGLVVGLIFVKDTRHVDIHK